MQPSDCVIPAKVSDSCSHTEPETALVSQSKSWRVMTQTAPVLWNGLHATLGRFHDVPDLKTLNDAAKVHDLRNAHALPIQFVQQTKPCGQRDYETQIHDQGLVPTRPGHWHDIFNACMWLTYPKTKAALNAVHLRQPPVGQRSPASDAATLFDESGAVLIGPDPRLASYLINHDWKTAFVTERHLWQTHHLLIIGHSVLEKLANPYPGMIAKVIYQPWAALSQSQLNHPPVGLDEAIAKRWQADEFIRPSQLFPLPVFGLPGADSENEAPGYYDNQTVFRVKSGSEVR